MREIGNQRGRVLSSLTKAGPGEGAGWCPESTRCVLGARGTPAERPFHPEGRGKEPVRWPPWGRGFASKCGNKAGALGVPGSEAAVKLRKGREQREGRGWGWRGLRTGGPPSVTVWRRAEEVEYFSATTGALCRGGVHWELKGWGVGGVVLLGSGILWGRSGALEGRAECGLAVTVGSDTELSLAL